MQYTIFRDAKFIVIIDDDGEYIVQPNSYRTSMEVTYEDAQVVDLHSSYGVGITLALHHSSYTGGIENLYVFKAKINVKGIELEDHQRIIIAVPKKCVYVRTGVIKSKPKFKKYALHSGDVVSSDGDVHYISFRKLKELYRLPSKWCVDWCCPTTFKYVYSDYIHLHPRADGKYEVPKQYTGV